MATVKHAVARRMITRTTQPPTVAPVAPVLRRSRAVPRFAENSAIRKEVEEKLKSIAIYDQQIAEAHTARANLEAEIASVMSKDKLSSVVAHGYSVGFEDVMTRASIEVDPRKLINSLNEEDFFSVVKVGITELRKVMTEREIDQIGVKTAAKKNGTRFVIERVKVKK